MAQETKNKQKNNIGVVMLLSALILGLAFYALNLMAKNEKNILTPPASNEKTIIDEEEGNNVVEVTEYTEIKETSNTPEEINNDVLDSLDADMQKLESTVDDISDLQL